MDNIPSRYGLALYSLALEKEMVLLWQEQVKEIAHIFRENSDFLTILSSSFLTIEERNEMIEKTLVGVDIDIINWIKIIITNNRINYLLDIFSSFNSCCNEYRDIKEGLIYSATPLDESSIQKIETKISQVEKKQIELRNIVDPTLIGGIKVVIDDHIYDGSIQNKLNKMRETLLKKEDD